MTDAAIIQATFSEWRMVKGRKVLQIICEVPLEAQGRVFAALGAPMPDTDTWVAIARLRDQQTASEPEQIAAEPDNMIEPPANDDRAPRPLSQVSAILCGIFAFRCYLFEAFNLGAIPTKDEAADIVREKCGVRSRSELDTDEAAASNFRHLRNGYDAWMRAA
jgi:hypothetical protein